MGKYKMKIIKLALFENEGRDPLELPERSDFEAQQELNKEVNKEEIDKELGKKGMSHTAEVLSLAMKSIGNTIKASYVADGSVGWVKHSDGIIYEIQVSPAALGKYFTYFQELNTK